MKTCLPTPRSRQAALLGLAALAFSGCYTKLHTRSEIVRHHYGYIQPPADPMLYEDSLYSDSLAAAEEDSVVVQNKRTVVVHDYYHVERPRTYWDFSLGFYSPHYRDYYGGYYWYDHPHYYYPRHGRYYHGGRYYYPPRGGKGGSGGTVRPPSDPNYKSDKRLFNSPPPQNQPGKGKRRQPQSSSQNEPAPKSSSSSAPAASDSESENSNEGKSVPARGKRR